MHMPGSFEALTESKTKMKVVTWQLIKGDTQTAPLLSYEDGKDLGMILVSNAISKEAKQSEDTSHINELLEEYKDRFEGIGTLKGIQVDLNVDPDFKPIVQPPRRQPFSIREKYNTFWTKISLKRLTSQRDGYHRQWSLPRRIRARFA